MFFGRKQQPPQTPFGEGRLIGDRVAVDWLRWNGVLLTLDWPKNVEPDQTTLAMIREGLDSFMRSAIDRLGFHEFPVELRTIVPDSIALHPDDPEENWSLTFRCAEGGDYIWGVSFRNHEIVRDFCGD